MAQAGLAQIRGNVLAAFTARGVGVVDLAPADNISILVDSRIEKRWVQTWELTYSTETPVVEIPACEIVRVDAVFESTTASPPLTIDTSEALDPC